MDHAKAVTIIKEVAPKLVIDPLNASHPMMVVVRRAPGASPFSIHLPALAANPERTAAETEAEEHQTLVTSVASAQELLPPLAT